MRINNTIRDYIATQVGEKASKKRDELVAAYDKLNNANRSEEEKKRELLGRYLKQLCDQTRKDFVKYAESIGFTFGNIGGDDFVSNSVWDVGNKGKYGNWKEVDAARKAIGDFDKEVKKRVDELLFKLSIGKDYDELMKEINSLKF